MKKHSKFLKSFVKTFSCFLLSFFYFSCMSFASDVSENEEGPVVVDSTRSGKYMRLDYDSMTIVTSSYNSNYFNYIVCEVGYVYEIVSDATNVYITDSIEVGSSIQVVESRTFIPTEELYIIVVGGSKTLSAVKTPISSYNETPTEYELVLDFEPSQMFVYTNSITNALMPIVYITCGFALGFSIVYMLKNSFSGRI